MMVYHPPFLNRPVLEHLSSISNAALNVQEETISELDLINYRTLLPSPPVKPEKTYGGGHQDQKKDAIWQKIQPLHPSFKVSTAVLSTIQA